MMKFERVCANLGFCHTLYYYHTNAQLCHTEGVSPKYPKRKMLFCKIIWILRSLRFLKNDKKYAIKMTGKNT